MSQMSFGDLGEGITGEEMMRMAEEWIAKNRNAWYEMQWLASGFVAEGRRFSMETLMQEARYKMRTNGHSQGFKVNNNTRSALARKLIEIKPECAKYMERRSSKVDWVA